MTAPSEPGIPIVNVGYRSTNYWVIGARRSRMLFDLGWPGTMGAMLASLRRMSVPLAEIRFGLASHYHIDHVGLAQELRQAGVRLLVMETQIHAILQMTRYTKPRDHYTEITTDDLEPVCFGESRALLKEIGIGGEILSTPGHSDDSVSLLLDDGSVFTGDLPPEEIPEGGTPELVLASWRMLHERGARRVYPAHGPVRLMSSPSSYPTPLPEVHP
ncbi:MAG: MBL fold metallo-hydrolase [Anaerolineales bacterium]|nr:MBL fold metallo-hydrolase [Anaerolineales bacterium]